MPRLCVLFWLLVFPCLALTGVGCAAAPVAYVPQDTLVKTIGPAEGTRRLREVMRRAVEPHVTTVEVTPEEYNYVFEGEIRIQWHNVASLHESQVEVYFDTVARVDIFAGHEAAVVSTRETELDRHQFRSRDDCELFADLVMSFVALRGVWPPLSDYEDPAHGEGEAAPCIICGEPRGDVTPCPVCGRKIR